MAGADATGCPGVTQVGEMARATQLTWQPRPGARVQGEKLPGGGARGTSGEEAGEQGCSGEAAAPRRQALPPLPIWGPGRRQHPPIRADTAVCQGPAPSREEAGTSPEGSAKGRPRAPGVHVTQCRQGDVHGDRSRACHKRRHSLLLSHARPRAERLREWLTQGWLVSIRRLLCPGHPVMSRGHGHGVNAGDLHTDPFVQAGALTPVTIGFRTCWSARWLQVPRGHPYWAHWLGDTSAEPQVGWGCQGTPQVSGDQAPVEKQAPHSRGLLAGTVGTLRGSWAQGCRGPARASVGPPPEARAPALHRARGTAGTRETLGPRPRVHAACPEASVWRVRRPRPRLRAGAGRPQTRPSTPLGRGLLCPAQGSVRGRCSRKKPSSLGNAPQTQMATLREGGCPQDDSLGSGSPRPVSRTGHPTSRRVPDAGGRPGHGWRDARLPSPLWRPSRHDGDTGFVPCLPHPRPRPPAADTGAPSQAWGRRHLACPPGPRPSLPVGTQPHTSPL